MNSAPLLWPWLAVAVTLAELRKYWDTIVVHSIVFIYVGNIVPLLW
jgi:hypothetical protein